MPDPPDILKKILDHKRGEVAAARAAMPLSELQARVYDLPSPLGFKAALQRTDDLFGTAIIAEVKKGSPSKGVIRPISSRAALPPFMRKTAPPVSPS